MTVMLKVFLFESEGDKESTTSEIWYRDLLTEQTFRSRMKYRSGVRSYKHDVGENLHTRYLYVESVTKWLLHKD